MIMGIITVEIDAFCNLSRDCRVYMQRMIDNLLKVQSYAIIHKST